MFELIIYFANGDVYWKERFDSTDALQSWLTVEMTRPYWKSDFTTRVIDHTPAPPPPVDEAAIAAKMAQIATLKSRVKTLTAQSDMTAGEIKESLMKFLKIQYLQNELD